MRTALAAHDEVDAGSRSRPTMVRCSSTPATGCAPPSRLHGPPSTLPWPRNGSYSLPVRMGIATGEAELRGDDYFGSVLNRAARVMAAGHGGQILLDGATAGLITGVANDRSRTGRLRDITLPVNVFQICADGLRPEFPPLEDTRPTPGNLRTPTTSFLGREAEIADLQRELKAHRLVTLTGPAVSARPASRWRSQHGRRTSSPTGCG